MNVKLSHDISFSAVVVDGNRIFRANLYTIKLNIITATENRTYQNVALRRILFFINEIFNGSILINIKNPNVTKLIKIAKDSQIIQLPDEPYDQIIGMILFDKLSVITEENLAIESIAIGSHIAKDLFYTVDDFEDFEYDSSIENPPWWMRSDTSVTNDTKILANIDTWSDLNLDWEEKDGKDIEFMLALDNEDDTIPEPKVIVLDGEILTRNK